jgi:hypothetical protein
MNLRCNKVLFAALAALGVACGGGAAGPQQGSGAISSLPAYPSARATSEPAPAPAKPKDAKEICAGASPVAASDGLGPARAPFDEEDKARFVRPAVGASPLKSKEFGMADLQALEKKAAWEELLGHAEDIPPAQRGAAWDKLVERAAIGYIESLTTQTAAFEGVFSSQALLKRYPHLVKSQDFMAKRGEAAKIAAERCLSRSYGGDHCIDMMKDFLKTSNSGAEVGFAFGKITRKNQNHYVAVPFFKWALEQKKDSAWCGDEDLKLAVIAGLGLPSSYENAAGARQIASQACWDSLKADVRKHLLESPEGYYRDNACAVLKAKGEL